MKLMETYIFFALISMLLYGITPLLYKLASSHTDAIFWIQQSGTSAITRQAIPYVGLAGFIASVAFFLYIKAITIGNVSVVKPIVGLSTLITVVLAITLFHEKIDARTVIGILFAILAILLLSR